MKRGEAACPGMTAEGQFMGKALLYRLSAWCIFPIRAGGIGTRRMVLVDEGFSGHLVQRNLRIPAVLALQDPS